MKKVTTPIWKVAVAAPLILILGAALLSGCNNRNQGIATVQSTQAKSTPLLRRAPSQAIVQPEDEHLFSQPASQDALQGILFLNGTDASASWRKVGLGESIYATAKISARLDFGKDKLVLYRVDERLNEYYSGAPVSRKQALLTIARHIGRASGYAGTYPAPFWRETSVRAASDQRLVVVCLWSEGDNDDQSPTARLVIQQAARKLASNPRVIGVFVMGAKGTNENWAALRRDLGVLGNRLHLVPDTQLQDVSLITRLIQDSRR